MSEHVYFYNGRIALSAPSMKNVLKNHEHSIFKDLFKNAYEAVFSSVKYSDYTECIRDSTDFIKEAAANIYDDDNFDLIWEPNPSSEYAVAAESGAMSSTAGIKPWDPAEIIRFYTLPKNINFEEPVTITILMSIYGGNENQFVVPPQKTTH